MNAIKPTTAEDTADDTDMLTIKYGEPDEDGLLGNMDTGGMFEYEEAEALFKKQEVEDISLQRTELDSIEEAAVDSELLLEEENRDSNSGYENVEETYLEETEPSPEPELVDLASGGEDEVEVSRINSYERNEAIYGPRFSHPADAADVQHDHAFAKTSKPNQHTRTTAVHPQLLKPKPVIDVPPNLLPIVSNNFVFTTPDGKMFQFTPNDGDPFNFGHLSLGDVLKDYVGVSARPPDTLSSAELGSCQAVTLVDEVPDAEISAAYHDESEETSVNVVVVPNKLSSSSKNSRRPAADSEVMKSSMLNITVPGGTSLQMQRYIYTTALCRVCLIPKDNMISLFEDVNVADNGLIENSRGPNTSNKFNLIPALKQMMDIDISYGDALPTEICIECLDSVMVLSEFRKKISIAQTKLSEIIGQVKNSNNPTVIPQLGVTDLGHSNIYRHFELISNAKEMLRRSKYSHNVVRYLPDRILEKIFGVTSVTVGYKSDKLKCLETYAVDPPYVRAWFCSVCRITIQGNTTDFVNHFKEFHEIVDNVDVPFGCDFCNEQLPLFDKTGLGQNYAEHWLHHFFFYECDICQKRMPSAKSVWVHKRSAHANPTRAFKCHTCKKSFMKKTHLVTHLKTHLNPEERKAFMNWCSICGKGLTSSLSVHMNSVHSEEVGNEPRWKCEICSKQFKKKENLIGHRDSVHHDLRKFVCEVCDESFKSHSTRVLHMLRHNGVKPHSCDKCDKKFLSTNALKSHQVTHDTSTSGFACDVCQKSFKRKLYLSEHMKLHSEPQHRCPHPNCDRIIRMKSNWYKHLKVHEKREKKLKAQEHEPDPPIEAFEITLDL